MFQNNELTADRFYTPKGASVGIRELRSLTGEMGTSGGYNGSVEGTSRVFNNAKDRLDSIVLGYTTPNEILRDANASKKLIQYYKLQSGELSGTLSNTNYRGILPHVKAGTKSRVLNSAPTEAQLVYNPVTKRREDARIYQPNVAAEKRARRLVSESTQLTDADKKFLLDFKEQVQGSVGMNEAAVITDNLRVTFERFRKNGEPWGNFKAVINSEMKNSITNVSEFIETQLRTSSDFFYKIKQRELLDPVLGPVQIEDLAMNFHSNIKERNSWEIRVMPGIAKELRPFVDINLPIKLRRRLTSFQLDEFYDKFAMRLARDDAPDRDQLAIGLGRDLYNLANYRGSKQEWYTLGVDLLDRAKGSGLYELESFGVKKRRMRSRMSGQAFQLEASHGNMC
jgi:hypothetical protein